MGNSAKTKLSYWDRERRQELVLISFCSCANVTAHNMIWTEKLVNKRWLKTHMEDDIEDWLKDDDVAVARSLRKLLVLLHVIFLVVDILIVLLCHPVCVCVRNTDTFITKNTLICTNGCVLIWGLCWFVCIWLCIAAQSHDRPLPLCMYEVSILIQSSKIAPVCSLNFTLDN